MNSINEKLTELFKKHRVVFWYDAKEELCEEFENASIDEVKKVQGNHNGFELKVTVHLNKDQKYLLYFPYEKPPDETNWLLDMELAYHVFQTDRVAIILQELELDNEYRSLVSDHIQFFASKERRKTFKELLSEGDGCLVLRNKMLRVVFSQANLNSFLLSHLKAFSTDDNKIDRDLDRYNLTKFYWSQIKNIFHFANEKPNIYEFIIEVFKSTSSLGKESALTAEGRVLLSEWKDSNKLKDSYEIISDRISKNLGVKEQLIPMSFEKFIEEDHFEIIDQKIIESLNEGLINRRLNAENVQDYIKKRESTFWYGRYKLIYDCLKYASQLMDLVPRYTEKIFTSIELGVKDYQNTLFKVDQVYRKFIYSYRNSTNLNSALNELYDKIEKVYSNDWLLTLNDNWQSIVNQRKKWPIISFDAQYSFFKSHVQPFVIKNHRVFVIISDALRFECAEELTRMLRSENKYQASIESMIGCLPSYTQLGMASLLPKKDTIKLKENSELIMVDGVLASGTEGRKKILEMNSGVKATAFQYEDFIRESKKDRKFIQPFKVIYIYSNLIDEVGDKITSENRVFEAVNQELEKLVELVKRIVGLNGSNILITSDHGFLYQHLDIDEGDFSSPEIKGEIWKKNRRFVMGTSLETDDSCKQFSGDDLGIQSNVDVVIPKSINRLRLQGSGSKFVHGGATLQEITIPLVKVHKIQNNTVRQVRISIIQNTSLITSYLLTVAFIQEDIVSDEVQSRIIRARIVTNDGELLSDVFKHKFDSSEDSIRQREVKHSFQLRSDARIYKNQQVKLVLQEPDRITVWKKYKEFHFTLNISIDWDEF